MTNYSMKLPAPYQHFVSTSTGGWDIEADFCPYVRSTTDALNATNVKYCTIRNSSMDPFAVGAVRSDAFCANCRAVRSTIINQTLIQVIQNPMELDPQCMAVVCVAPSDLRLRIGSSYFPCTSDGMVLEVTFPPSADFSQVPPPKNATAAFPSYYEFHGQVVCPRISFLCKPSNANSSIPALSSVFLRDSSQRLLTVSNWPRIVSIAPSQCSIVGGEAITVFGIFSRNALNGVSCRGLRIGGQPTDIQSYYALPYNSSTGLDAFVVNTTSLPGASSGSLELVNWRHQQRRHWHS